MDLYSIIIIVAFALSVVLGFLLGFGRTLSFLTKGIVGVILSIFFCITFGGMIAKIGFVSNLIQKGNDYFGQFAQILAKLNVATWIYYVILFFIAQIIRIIIVRIIKAIFQPKNKESKVYGVRSLINRILGALLFGAFCVLVVYLVMAVLALLTDVEGVHNLLETLGARKFSFFLKMYEHNPIDLSVLFG
ncbi:MAG: hypothetical protein IJ676_00495 [Clostridia bacterium]|nr:hypothetical protein [Clostridia bacterium]